MILLRSLKDNYKKITLSSIVVLMVWWIRNSAFNQEPGVRFPGGALFHKIKIKFKNLKYEIECCNRKKSKCEWDLDVRYAKERAPTFKVSRKKMTFQPVRYWHTWSWLYGHFETCSGLFLQGLLRSICLDVHENWFKKLFSIFGFKPQQNMALRFHNPTN